jgi:hypothetical protein
MPSSFSSASWAFQIILNKQELDEGEGEEAGREDELRNDNERLGSEGRELSELNEPVAESGRIDAMGGLMTTTMMDRRRVIGNV